MAKKVYCKECKWNEKIHCNHPKNQIKGDWYFNELVPKKCYNLNNRNNCPRFEAKRGT